MEERLRKPSVRGLSRRRIGLPPFLGASLPLATFLPGAWRMSRCLPENRDLWQELLLAIQSNQRHT